MKKYLPIIIFIALSITWGSSFILMKRGLEVYSPTQVGALRIIFAFLFMLPWGFKALSSVPRESLKYMAVVGLAGNLIPAFLFATAQTELTSSLTGILNGLTPLFTFLFGLLIFKNTFKAGQAVGLAIAFLGTLGLSFIGSTGTLDAMNEYVLLVVLATVCYAISSNVIKAKLNEIKALHITAVALTLVGPFAIGYLFFTDFTQILQTNAKAWEGLGYLATLGIVGTAIALIFFNRLIQMTSAVFATAVTYIIPIVAVGWGVWDGEQIFALHYVGMALIILGIYLVNKWK